MTFDQFANQGDTAAWDSDAEAATKKAAEKIFSSEPDETQDADDTAIKQDPHPPDEVPDPDITSD